MTKNVWITGASSGIGKALAIKFSTEGWHVAASARRENLLQDLNKNNPNINSFPLDVVNSESVKKVFNDILKKIEEIDLCIFSAGIYEPLMIYNSMKGKYIPWLATAHNWNDGNDTLTLDIRRNVKWSDGTVFSARDVWFTFHLLLHY